MDFRQWKNVLKAEMKENLGLKRPVDHQIKLDMQPKHGIYLSML
jgi:hypothetical protein